MIGCAVQWWQESTPWLALLVCALTLVLLLFGTRCLLEGQLDVLAALVGEVGALLRQGVLLSSMVLLLARDCLALHFAHSGGHPLRGLRLHFEIHLFVCLVHDLIIILGGHVLQLRNDIARGGRLAGGSLGSRASRDRRNEDVPLAAA